MKIIALALAAAAATLGAIGGIYAAAQDSNPATAQGPGNPLDASQTPEELTEELSLSQKCQEMLSQYRDAADSAQRSRLAEDVTTIVAAQFDARQRLRQQELQRLSKQLDRLRDIHVRRTQQKDRIVHDRVEQMLRDVDGLGWGESLAPPLPAVDVPMR